MPAAARRIGTLRLTTSSEDDVSSARLLVEDAFRIASFPETDRRLFVIRQIDLGTVELDRSSAALAPVMEAAVRAATGRAVRFDDPAAAHAAAVYFPDAVDAVIGFIVRIAERSGATEWYWPLVVAGGRRAAGMTSETGIRLALQHLLGLRGAGVHLAQVIDTLRASGREERLLECLRPDDGAAVAASLGLPSAPHAAPIHETSLYESVLTAPAIWAWHPLVATWAVQWGADDARTRWLAAVPLVITRPVLAEHPDLPALSQRVLLRATHPRSERAPSYGETPTSYVETTRAETAISNSPDTALMKASGAPRRGNQVLPHAPSLPTRLHPASPPHAAPVIDESVTMPIDADSTPWDGELRATDAAGLLFVVPILSRLLLTDTLDTNSALVEMQFPERLLTLIADRVGVPQTDPIRSPFVPAQTEIPASRFAYVAPVAWWMKNGRHWVERASAGDERHAWTDRSGRVVYASWRGNPPAELAAAPLPTAEPSGISPGAAEDIDRILQSWFTQVRRTVRRVAGLGLQALVARPGQVAITRTHIDVLLPPAQVDMRIRRSGLDADPGWVRWLGRVVAFHYEGET
jgi:hypothetical protein